MTKLREWGAAALTFAGISLMRVLAFMPLRLVRALGFALGWALYLLVGSRRRIVTINLTLCFKELSAPEIKRLTQQTFVYFAQAWLDRSWVWHAPRSWLLRRVTMTGAVDEVIGNEPTVMFTPHFVGMDAAWAGMVLRQPRQSVTIYTDQSNKQIDSWILRGRSRFGFMRLLGARRCERASRFTCCPIWTLARWTLFLCRFMGCRLPQCHHCPGSRVWAAPRWCLRWSP
jgi:Kdo2-lipid IVA lauroyltransferase/acyltransferase